MISRKEYIFPSSSYIDNPSLYIAFSDSFVGFAILWNIFLKDVPAISALIPLFAIRPRAIATSSTEYPSDPATGATYLNDCPIIETLVFALVAAEARISENRPASDADRPNAVSASVTISDVVPSSSPDAAARLMIPSIPLSISSVFQPAIAIYSNASPDSVAEYFVCLPISRALLSN